MEIFDKGTDYMSQYAIEYGVPLLKAIAILVIGIWIIKAIRRGVRNSLSKSNVDESLRPFLISLLYNSLLILLILTALSTLGVQMTSFVAIIGAAGLAIGLSLQGTLQNFAGGVILLTLRPFKVGDYIDGAGYSGTVQSIQIFQTLLLTPDNKKIVIPNGKLSNDGIVNYSAEDKRRVDMVFGIGYGDDIKKAKDILVRLCQEDERVLEEPAFRVDVSSLGDSSVNFNVRPWVQTSDYWNVFWDFQEKVKLTFDKEGISIPFPQRDVHIYNEK
ncbi:mechanosensitive ion channel family protein [Fulvivirga lutea]|uniref:Mechanosensitive ion channel n=1 Tax=Fulvivirga lutea TaxID=2810512 RepID=A0A974WEP9_9BACT|nr:mechanosensitive ion channel domain-containing protein [Fulvivirga lutea]QSE97003.1 mechanosensitive ion channel [Fulvivirga lutea]